MDEIGKKSIHFIQKDSVLEYQNKESMTAILLAAKYNQLDCVMNLFNEGARIYDSDNKMQNVLHYSIINENEQLIKFFIENDGKQILRKEKNYQGQIPIDLEQAKQFTTWLYTIWDCVASNMTSLITKYIQQGSYQVN